MAHVPGVDQTARIDPTEQEPAGKNAIANAVDADAQAEKLIRTRLFITGSAIAAIPILGLYAYLDYQAGFRITGILIGLSAVLILINAWWVQRPARSTSEAFPLNYFTKYIPKPHQQTCLPEHVIRCQRTGASCGRSILLSHPRKG